MTRLLPRPSLQTRAFVAGRGLRLEESLQTLVVQPAAHRLACRTGPEAQRLPDCLPLQRRSLAKGARTMPSSPNQRSSSRLENPSWCLGSLERSVVPTLLVEANRNVEQKIADASRRCQSVQRPRGNPTSAASTAALPTGSSPTASAAWTARLRAAPRPVGSTCSPGIGHKPAFLVAPQHYGRPRRHWRQSPALALAVLRRSCRRPI